MSTDQDVDRFLQNPSIDQLKQNPALIDRVGGRIGKLCVDNDFGEHQLRRVHERLLDLYYSSKRLASKPGAGVGLGRALDTELVRLKYFIAYQWSRFDYQKGRSYFEPFMKLVDQVKDFEAVEKLFYLSEAIIAYYNYHNTIKEVSGRGGGVQRRVR
jgi:CRISPR type III-A-associated protein Csm2